MAAHEVEPSELPLKYKTWVLKVSIHCEACKKKVKKVLMNIEGVYTADIDRMQQRVIVTGNVNAETLIKKLMKSGKHAELWPERADERERNSSKSKNNEKQSDHESGEVKVKSVQESVKTNEISGGGGGGVPAKISEDGGAAKVSDGAAKNTGGEQVVKEAISEGKKPETGATVNQSPQPPLPVDKKGGESDGVGAEKSGGGGGGNGGKKKKKKVQFGNNVEGEPSSAAPATRVASPNHNTGPSSAAPATRGASPNHNGGPPPDSVSANHSPPRHHGYQYPPHYYYVQPPPVYGVSYNTAYPSSSYTTSYNTAYPSSSHTASYYAVPPPNSYAYSYQGPETEHPPSDFETHPRQPLDSFDIFSDENPNGCSVV